MEHTHSTGVVGDVVVVLSDGETFTGLSGSTAMLLAPGDPRRLADGDVVDPLDVYDLSDPTDLRRLADRLEAPR